MAAISKKEDLAALARALTERLDTRYGLPVRASEPQQTGGKISTWKLPIETRPAQRIHRDTCAIPSHDPRPMMLRHLYGIDLGTSGLILQSQSREEILADKIIALAFREYRLMNRDLWDIAWLVQHGVTLPAALIPVKIADHRRERLEFSNLLRDRLDGLKADPALREDFVREMRRFLPAATVRETLAQPAWWGYLTSLLDEQARLARAAL